MNNETKIQIKKTLGSKTFKAIVYTLGILTIIFFVFEAGMIVGFKRTSFNRDWNNNYATNFSPHDGPKMMVRQFGNLPNAHGAIGKIIRVELPTIIVLDEKDNTEKSVLINDKTQIREDRISVTSDKLKIDDHIIVIGVPNPNGQIEARLIRFIPLAFRSSIKAIN